MKKQEFLILLVIVLVIGGIFFFDQVLAVFQGMSVLEAMQFIVQFVLHVAVVTILSYVAYTLPEIVKPWLKAFRSRRRRARRQPTQKQSHTATPKGRLTNAQIMQLLMMSQQSGRTKARVTEEQSQDSIPLDF